MIYLFILDFILLAIAIMSNWWFWWLPKHKKLKDKFLIWDSDKIETIIGNTPISFEQFRNFKHQGNKIVLIHHLLQLGYDTEPKIRNAILTATTVLLIFLIFIYYFAQQHDPNITIGSIDIIDTLPLIYSNITQHFYIPLAPFIYIYKSILFFYSFEKELSKYIVTLNFY